MSDTTTTTSTTTTWLKNEIWGFLKYYPKGLIDINKLNDIGTQLNITRSVLSMNSHGVHFPEFCSKDSKYIPIPESTGYFAVD